jgi:glutamate racemase
VSDKWSFEIFMKSQPVIGVFDSGVGGLTVLKSLMKALPEASYVYIGDSARTPYGTKSPETIVQYSFECTDFLLSKGVDVVVVACNTASTAALSNLKSKLTIPVYGMVEPASHEAVSLIKDKTGPIAVIGTEGTIASHAYDRYIKTIDPNIVVVSAACPLFVPIVEQGIFSGTIVEEIMSLYLEEIRSCNPSALILACTHYPLLSKAIKDFIGNDTTLVTSADALAHQLQDLYGKSSSGGEKEVSVSFFTTDNEERFNRLGSMILAPLKVQSKKIQL